jgi:hypothetical protein
LAGGFMELLYRIRLLLPATRRMALTASRPNQLIRFPANSPPRCYSVWHFGAIVNP